ncbi:MAG: hypothetical protein FK734_04890 [Asgard group archaeon]|nr:hypothetical protein [Asgard group archaeon]
MSRESNPVFGLTDDNIYLSKILLFTPNALDVAEKLQEFNDTTVNTNCLNTIGMYPLISRIETSLGQLCMSIWIINPNDRFEQFRMAYYSGASHCIILTEKKSDLAQIVNLYRITPKGVPLTIITKNKPLSQVDTQYIINDDQNQTNISLKSYKDILSITAIFEDIGRKIARDILAGEYQTFSPQLVKPSNIFKLINKKSYDKANELVSRLGYELEPDGIINVHKDEFTFEIDFYRNQVKAKMTNCISCDKRCKHYRKLCVLEENQGYSNSIHFDNLRALAILYSIHDGDFELIPGSKPREDIRNQLKKLKDLYEVNCSYEKEEEEFQRLYNSNKKRRNKIPK